MTRTDAGFRCVCGKVYTKENGVVLAWPTNMDELSKEEAEYHDHFDEQAVEVHQLDAWRNKYYHERIWSAIKTIPSGSTLLEIGAGSGYDASQLKGQYHLVLTDISSKTLERLRQTAGDATSEYIAADGVALPFGDTSFDGVYTVATWHHFADPEKALNEMKRVLKPGGTLVIGVEPNQVYFKGIKRLRHVLCHATHTHEHDGSHADAEMEGFSKQQLQELFASWQDVSIQPMWFFAGWMHYGLEFLFRALKLKRRIALPLWLERAVVQLDESLFKLPLINGLGWHWIIVARK